MVDLEVFQQPVLEAKHPAVHDGILILGVRLLDGSSLDNVAALLLNAELDETVVTRGLVRNGVQLLLVESVDVANVTEPWIQQAQVLGRHGSLDAAAAVVAADDDVLDVEVAHGILDDAHNVKVGVDHQVGDVAVDEGLARLQAGNLLCRDARVAASNPQILGTLAGTQLGEEAGIFLPLLGSPGAVVLEQTVMRLLKILGDIRGRHAVNTEVLGANVGFGTTFVSGIVAIVA